MLVIKADEHRTPERGALEQRLKVLQQPVALLGQCVQISKGAPVEERRVTTEKRLHQRSQLHDAFAWLGGAGADRERHALSDPRALFEQPALAHSGAALYQEDRANAGANPIELATEGGQFGISTAGDQPGECRLSHEASLCRFATKAVKEVPERGSVIMDSGSTTLRLAEVFPVERDVHVVTNSLMAALTLSRRGLRQLTVLGGAVRTNTLAMVDDTTRGELEHMAFDVLFISCDGLSFQHGLTTPYREEHMIKRAMIGRARRLVAVVDASKFGNVQMFSYAAFDEIDVLVTDTRAAPDAVAALASHGIEVHRV